MPHGGSPSLAGVLAYAYRLRPLRSRRARLEFASRPSPQMGGDQPPSPPYTVSVNASRLGGAPPHAFRRKWEEDHDRFLSCRCVPRTRQTRRRQRRRHIDLERAAKPQCAEPGDDRNPHSTFHDIAGDEKARVVVLAGEGPALSSGHDLKEMQAHRNDADRGRDYYVELFARCAVLMQAIVALPKPVIAAVEGVATAAGCQLVASCDLAIAGEQRDCASRRYQRPLLFFAAGGGRPAVSRKHAMEMALTGKLFSAGDAERFGLVNRVVAEGQALSEAKSLARTIAERSAPTLAIGKRTFYAQIERPLDEAYALASRAMIDNLAEPDLVEGTAAFLEKRRPIWGA